MFEYIGGQMKFIHISDIHFGKTYKNKDIEISKLLINEQRNAFKKMVQIAISNDVEAVLIAGDMFHTTKVSFADEQFVHGEFKKLEEAEVQVFYCSGNHDFTNAESSVRKLRFLENIHTFFDESYSAIVIEGRYRVVGCGHDNKHEMRDLISDFPQYNDGIPTIGLGHSMINSALSDGSEGAYMASSVEAIQKSGYDYWALGHIHKAGKVHESIECYYSGSLSGLSSKEAGDKGGFIIDFTNNKLQSVKFLELSNVLWKNIEVNCALLKPTVQSVRDLYEVMLERVREVTKDIEEHKRIFITMTLEGRTHLARNLMGVEIGTQLETQLVEDTQIEYAKVKVLTRQNIDIERMVKEEGLLKELTLNIKNEDRLSDLINLLLEENLFQVAGMDDKREYIREMLLDNYEKIVGYILGDDYDNQ